jgi:hypothetical protein
MIKDPFAYMYTPGGAKSPLPQIKSPYAAGSEGPNRGRQRGVELLNTPSDYAWLDLQDSYKSPTKRENSSNAYISR